MARYIDKFTGLLPVEMDNGLASSSTTIVPPVADDGLET